VSIKFRKSINIKPQASNQTTSIEEYNEMQTSYKAGVKQIISDSNQISNHEHQIQNGHQVKQQESKSNNKH
jgi:hypothetical protein